MASYKVQWKYASSLGGPWQEGDVVQLDHPLAEAIMKDSPGVLEPIKKKNVEPEAEEPVADDRQLKTASKRADRSGSKSDQGAIDKKTFKATKGQ